MAALSHLGKAEAAPQEYDVERIIRVVLSVVHLNHVSGEDDDDNLKALCQWCHLNHDKGHHAETRAIRKDAARPLLVSEERRPHA